MFELILLIAAVFAVYKVADADEQSGFLWAAVTLLAGIASVVLLPGLPFIRVGIAFAVGLGGMFTYKLTANR